MTIKADESAPVLYGPDGGPLRAAEESPVHPRRPRVVRSSAFSSMSGATQWMEAFAGIQLTPSQRARDPFGNHPWVLAAGVAIAVTASQAPYTIFRETEAEVQRRRAREKRLGRPWRGPSRGDRRTAFRRHGVRSAHARAVTRSLEPDHGHPLTAVLERPNPYQDGGQLQMMTDLWLAVRGECFWVQETEDGSPVLPGFPPARIWPLSPDLFTPILSDGSFGELVAWSFAPPYWMRQRLKGLRVELPLSDVIHFKGTPDPTNPLRGLSRIGACALGIETDMMAKAHNRSILQNGGDPGGVITYDEMMEREEESEFLDKWRTRQEGPENARRTALLSGGFKYVPVALSPKDMEFIATLQMDREEILANMGVPRSVLGVPDQNYATQLGQDFNFWDKTLIPQMRSKERTLDATLLHPEPDSVVGLHDLRDVEALRAGVAQKVEVAGEMAGDALHVSPRAAFRTVGLQVEEYEGDEEALVSPGQTTVGEVLSGNGDDDGEAPRSPQDASEVADDVSVARGSSRAKGGEEGDAGGDERARDALELIRHRLQRAKARRWQEFIEVEGQVEDSMSAAWRSWAGEERRVTLEAFDAAAAELTSRGRRLCLPSIGKNLESFVAYLGPETDTINRMKPKTRPVYADALGRTYEFTLTDLGGTAFFEPDDQLLLDVVDQRETRFTTHTSSILRKRLTAQIAEGINQSETIGQLRLRIAQVFDIQAGTPKTLTVARTESAGFMNSERDAMFRAAEIEQEFWSTAGDEVVRDSHKVFGAEDAHEYEYNYLIAVGKTGAGVLAFPGDSRCTDASEVVNCRCLKVPG